MGDADWTNRVRDAAKADVRAMLRQARRRRVERWLAAAMVLVAIIALLVLVFRTGLLDSSPSAAPAPPGSGLDAPEPAGPDAPVVDLAQPFARTPAQGWPDGESGIVTPTAVATGEFNAAEVAAATKQVRDILIASRLDRRMLVDHDPSEYLGQLAVDARKQLEPLFHDGREPQAQALVSMVDSASLLLPAQPKVNGSMSVHAGANGELVVHTNYVFAYAFDARGAPLADPMDVVVVVRADVDYVLRHGGRWLSSSQGMWYGTASGYGYSIACDAYRKGFLAPAFSDRNLQHVPSPQGRQSYFDPSSPLPAESGCPK